MNPGTIYLKVKLVSLADEAKTIRRLEHKMNGYAKYTKRVYEATKSTQDRDTMWKAQIVYIGLYEHRLKDVASEARAANIALGLIKGKKYCQIENKIKGATRFGKNILDMSENKLYSVSKMWERVARIAYKYSDGMTKEAIGFTPQYIRQKTNNLEVYVATNGVQPKQLEDAKFEAFRELVFAWRDEHPMLRVKNKEFATA